MSNTNVSPVHKTRVSPFHETDYKVSILLYFRSEPGFRRLRFDVKRLITLFTVKIGSLATL